MKNFIFKLLIFSLIFTSTKHFSQCGGNTTVTLSSQQQVNDFPSIYPGCSLFSGNIQILNGADITDLTPLSQLNSITGFLRIQDNPLLTSFTGLQNITDVQSLEIINNDNLPNLNGLNSLTNIGYNLLIQNNDILQNINGLQNLISVGVSGNEPGVLIINNLALQNLNGLASLAVLKGGLNIRSNASLNDVSKINITSIQTGAGNALVIEDNNALQNLSGMYLQELKGNVNIIGNASLQSVNLSVGNSSQIYSLLIKDNPLLTDISGFSTVTNINNSFGGLQILNNDSMQNLNGLNNVTNINNRLFVKDNDLLQHINALSSLVTTGATTSIEIMNNASLLHLDGLSSLTKTGKILVQNNNALKNLNGFSAIIQLTTTSETKLLSVFNNPELESISGVQNINQATIASLIIVNNPKVEICHLPNICDYLTTAKPRSISGNKTGCNSVAEVVNACATLGINESELSKITCYPNPVSDIINLSEKVEKIEIIDQNGRILKKENNLSKIEVKHLTSGMYYLKISNGQKTETKKFIKK